MVRGIVGTLRSSQRIGPNVGVGHDPVAGHPQGPSSTPDGGRFAAALDQGGQPGAADVQVQVRQGQGALGAASKGAVRVGPLEVELDRPLGEDRCSAGGDEGGNDRVEPVAARVPAASTRSQVNIAIRRIR